MIQTMSTQPDYSVWRTIDYKPAISNFLPVRLLPFLEKENCLLDVGCNTGNVALYFAEHGYLCNGIDINPAAITEAKARGSCHPQGSRANFEVANWLSFDHSGKFHAILMTRFLTCVPGFDDWHSCLTKAFALLRPNGLLYVHDFVLDPYSPIYAPRYALGKANGWREGNFPVHDSEGSFLFIAHHHSETDILEMIAPYNTLVLDKHDSVSMNGNPCCMLEYIGRKLAPP